MACDSEGGVVPFSSLRVTHSKSKVTGRDSCFVLQKTDSNQLNQAIVVRPEIPVGVVLLEPGLPLFMSILWGGRLFYQITWTAERWSGPQVAHRSTVQYSVLCTSTQVWQGCSGAEDSTHPALTDMPARTPVRWDFLGSCGAGSKCWGSTAWKVFFL